MRERLELDPVPTKVEKRNAKKAYLARLCENKDFALWFYGILEDLCAFEHGLGRFDDFAQGKRAAGSYMIDSLHAAGDSAVKMMAAIYTKHFGKHNHENKEDK